MEYQHRSDAEELAVIYETQQKEEKIAHQEAELSQQRLFWVGIIFVAMVVFFIIFTIYRVRAAKRLSEMKAAQERIEGELQIARDIQMSMVPHDFPVRNGLDMYAAMTPAREVGGDLYGYVLKDDSLYFAIGDVSGKGVPASLFMAQATSLFQTLASQGMAPAEICTLMNNTLSGDNNESGMFVTFFLGVINLTTGHLSFCNAGHNPPVIGGDADHGNFLEMNANAPIGLWPGLEYEGEELETIKGRPLFFYTDGLNEAENSQQQQFGDEHLLDILRHTQFDSARQVIETLTAEVERHRNGADPNDDLSMMCIEVN
jgi:serine phosphatase RsbU (regulator of sigma subunit)